MTADRVKRAALTVSGVSATSMPTSFRPSALMPAATPAQRNPAASVPGSDAVTWSNRGTQR